LTLSLPKSKTAIQTERKATIAFNLQLKLSSGISRISFGSGDLAASARKRFIARAAKQAKARATELSWLIE
jgi:hypothetical protein